MLLDCFFYLLITLNKSFLKIAGKKCWTVVEGKTAKGLLGGSTKNVYLCFLYCVVLEACDVVAFDVKSRSNCWYSFGLLGSIKEEDLIPMPGSVAYMLDRSCMKSAGLESSNLNEVWIKTEKF